MFYFVRLVLVLSAYVCGHTAVHMWTLVVLWDHEVFSIDSYPKIRMRTIIKYWVGKYIKIFYSYAIMPLGDGRL